jgi:hypothetical protein
LVLERALASYETNFIPDSNAVEREEERVSMTGQRDVAPFAGQNRSWKVAYGPPQLLRRIALNDDCMEA